MATSPFPIPRGTRETGILAGNGTPGPYGPITFKVFDEDDIVVLAKAHGEDIFSDVTASCAVTKIGGEVYDSVVVLFDIDVPPDTVFVVQARRRHERQLAVTKGGSISAIELEKELSKQGTVISELRRDVDRAVQFGPGFSGETQIPALGDGRPPIWNAAEQRFVQGPDAGEIASAGTHADAAADSAAASQAWAEGDEPGGENTKSSKDWSLQAQAAAAGLNLPPIEPGDAGKYLVVKDTEDGYNHRIILGAASGLLALELSETRETYVAMGDAFADGFKSLAMVDAAGATNLDTSETGFLKPENAAGGNAGTSPFGGGGGRGIGGGNGNSFALQFVAPASGTITSTKINVPNHTSAGSFEARLYTDSAGSPGAQVGASSSSQSIASTGDKTFTFDTPPPIVGGSTYWMVIANVSGAPAFNVSTQANSGAAFKAGRGDVITSITDNLPSSEEWEVEILYAGAPANLTVASEIIPVALVPTAVSGGMRVIPTDALTLDTDFMLDVSRNNGAAWAAAPLALSFVDGGVSVLRFDPVDLSSQPSASQPRWRIRSANGKSFKVDGIHMEFIL